MPPEARAVRAVAAAPPMVRRRARPMLATSLAPRRTRCRAGRSPAPAPPRGVLVGQPHRRQRPLGRRRRKSPDRQPPRRGRRATLQAAGVQRRPATSLVGERPLEDRYRQPLSDRAHLGRPQRVRGSGDEDIDHPVDVTVRRVRRRSALGRPRPETAAERGWRRLAGGVRVPTTRVRAEWGRRSRRCRPIGWPPLATGFPVRPASSCVHRRNRGRR